MTINRRVEQLEEILNRGGGGTCPHLPFKLREFTENADGTRDEGPYPLSGRYAPKDGVPNDLECDCGRPRLEVHIVETDMHPMRLENQ